MLKKIYELFDCHKSILLFISFRLIKSDSCAYQRHFSFMRSLLWTEERTHDHISFTGAHSLNNRRKLIIFTFNSEEEGEERVCVRDWRYTNNFIDERSFESWRLIYNFMDLITIIL